MNKTCYHCQLDDKVCFFGETSESGAFPEVYRGTVEEIKRGYLRIKIDFQNSSNLVWVKMENCYRTTRELFEAFTKHFEKQVDVIFNPDIGNR